MSKRVRNELHLKRTHDCVNRSSAMVSGDTITVRQSIDPLVAHYRAKCFPTGR